MTRVFDRNIFIMLAAVMVGVIIITYFVADIVNKSKIENLTTEHIFEIQDVNSRNENFTDNFLQGSIMMDSAREVREVANLNFDFALFWFNNALVNASVWFNNKWVNTTEKLIERCIENCSNAMIKYLTSHNKFGESKPYFVDAKSFTESRRYIEVLGYYVNFSQLGQTISILRYNASKFIKQAAENLSLGALENVTLAMENFSMMEGLYQTALGGYIEMKERIDDYTFFDEIREEH
ncbi:MAG: hypothetical protein JSW06_07880 [Thermoplasmatales archaeon]|nr:MAG: hypothetical protein JSW06_07880 [Thermoplasmatales archaeon]